MNTTPCRACKFYDPLRTPKLASAPHGWCAVKSLYPCREGPGQSFPPGVKRVEDPEAPAKPVIVRGDAVVSTCVEVQAK